MIIMPAVRREVFLAPHLNLSIGISTIKANSKRKITKMMNIDQRGKIWVSHNVYAMEVKMKTAALNTKMLNLKLDFSFIKTMCPKYDFSS